MNEQELEQLKYPIGRFKNPENFTPEFLENCISIIEKFPEKLKKEVQRAKTGEVSLKKEDVFKKYNFFLEYKLWEKNNIDLKNKKFNLQLGGLIKSLCK